MPPMSRQSGLTDLLGIYLRKYALKGHPALGKLAAETEKNPAARMMTDPIQANFLGFLLKSLNAQRVIEVGAFTGFGTLNMALALPAGGHVDTFDVDDKTLQTGRPFWKEAGVENRITFHHGPAADNLRKLTGPFDFAYVDADKQGYGTYYDVCLSLMRPGGVVALDNMLWSGRVANPAENDPGTVILRDLTARVMSDQRVDACLLPIGDGLLLARRK